MFSFLWLQFACLGFFSSGTGFFFVYILVSSIKVDHFICQLYAGQWVWFIWSNGAFYFVVILSVSLFLRRLRHGLPPLLDDSESHYVTKVGLRMLLIRGWYVIGDKV